LKKIGIEPGKSLTWRKPTPPFAGRSNAPEEAQQLMAWKIPMIARVVNGWLVSTDTVGVYGNYYLKRAIVVTHAVGPAIRNFPHEFTVQRFHRMLGARLLWS
jgi:hypothetical protein